MTLKTLRPFSPCSSMYPDMKCCPFCICFFIKSCLCLPELHTEKPLLDAAHDSYSLFNYCKTNKITPFNDLKPGNSGHYNCKNDFTVRDGGVPICQIRVRMPMMVLKNPNTAILLLIEKINENVLTPVLIPNMEEPFIF